MTWADYRQEAKNRLGSELRSLGGRMDQTGEIPPNGIEAVRRKLEPIIALMPDDERTGAVLMRAYFHVYLNVRFIGQSNILIAVFQDLLEAGCEYRDVHSGMV